MDERFQYVIYIAATPDKVFSALIDPRLTRQYWQHENISDWQAGSRWEHWSADPERVLRLSGTVVESRPPRRLVLTWALPADEANEQKQSRVSLEVEPYRDVSRLTVTHDRLEPGSEMLRGITDGWPKVLASLKSLLETGRALPKLW